MLSQRPRFVLIAETQVVDAQDSLDENQCQWRFALHGLDSTVSILAHDVELGACPERLELLAVVRGLEALDQPSEVTLVSSCASLRRGIQRDIEQWRNNHWRWERFGRQILVRNADLWQRIDRALEYHKVICRGEREEESETNATVAKENFSAANERAFPPTVRLLAGRLDSPAMIVVPGKRTRRTIRIKAEESTFIQSAAG